MATSASFFVILFIMAAFILVKYLIIQGKCKRRPMVLFYLATIVVILLKIGEFVLLIYHPFFDEAVIDVHLVGIIAILFVGIIHSYNLMKLISDLRTINAKNESDYRSMQIAFCARRILMAFWMIICIALIILIVLKRQTKILLINAIVFFLLAA